MVAEPRESGVTSLSTLREETSESKKLKEGSVSVTFGTTSVVWTPFDASSGCTSGTAPSGCWLP